MPRGDDAQAEPLLDRAWEIAQATLVNYFGPTILACIAQVTHEEERREWALATGERLLAGDCVSHCYLHFYKIGIDIAADLGNAGMALRYAGLLEDYTSREPLALIDFVVAQGRAIARKLQDRHSAEVNTELRALRDRASKGGFASFVPRLDAALAA